jgi:hypothetical protein
MRLEIRLSGHVSPSRLPEGDIGWQDVVWVLAETTINYLG